MTAPLASYWRKVEFQIGTQPKPRHGHRAVTFKNEMVIFGGGNEGIIEEFHVFKNAEQRWYTLPIKGDIPPGCAAFGFTNDETRAWIFGGMLEYGKYSNELFELKLGTWECRRLKPRIPKSGAPIPKPRLGHSFNLIGNKIYLFGGLANDSPNPKQNLPKYLNDLYTLEIKANSTYQWDLPNTNGIPPCPRESHSAVPFFPQNGGGPKLIIYAGMCGLRLQDLWILEIDTMTWSKPVVHGIPPAPRSLHSANVIGDKMYIFGGWVPMLLNTEKPEALQDKEWKCTNTVAVFDIPSCSWEYVSNEISDESAPKARAGHCAVNVGTRILIFSGRDGYRKAWNNQVCCKDLWLLETSKPSKPERIVLSKSGTSVLEITWGSVYEADKFLVQIQKVDPAEFEDAVKEMEPTMSGIGVLAAAAAAQTPQKVALAKANTTPGVRYLSPQIVANPASSQIKLTPGGGQQMIRLVSGGTGAAGKQFMVKTAGGQIVGQPGMYALVKTSQGMALTNTSGTTGGQMVRVVSAPSAANKSTSSPLTTMITPVATGAKAPGTSNVRMIVVPQGSPRAPGAVNTIRLPALAPGQKTVRLPASVLNGGIAGGTQKILVASGGANNNYRVMTTSAVGTTGSPQRFVLLSSGQTLTTNTSAAVVSASSSSSGSITVNPSTTTKPQTTIATIAKSTAEPTATSTSDATSAAIQEEPKTTAPETIPQTDGPDDEIPVQSTNNLLSSSENDSAIASAIASISSLEPSSRHEPENQSSNNESNSGDVSTGSMPTEPSTSKSDQTANTAASVDSSSTNSAVNGNSKAEEKPSNVKLNTWYNVGTFNSNSCAISQFLVPSDEECLASFNPDGELTSTTILNYDNFDRVSLEPGATYKIRVCGINIRGRGPWSDFSSFKTSQLGFPPAPAGVKINKTTTGVHLSWTIPGAFSPSDVSEFAVYLGVHNQSQENANIQSFLLVYQAAPMQCFISNETLAQAWVNPFPKPAILFRIAAKNPKGFGPATQVRWLQETGKRPLVAKSETPTSTKKNKA